ncbi:MAG: hypothetical protein K0S81_2819 [Rhodospirillales bacterium]|nr:hypothetical protein [Rhodospirillales bacterium]
MSGAKLMPEDPVGLIGQALAMGSDFPGPAEDVLLSWMMKLDPAVDPIAAAAALIRHYGVGDGDLPPGESGKLIRLLRETAACTPGGVGRRSGRRARLSRP